MLLIALILAFGVEDGYPLYSKTIPGNINAFLCEQTNHATKPPSFPVKGKTTKPTLLYDAQMLR